MSNSEDMPRADLSDAKLKIEKIYAAHLEARNKMRSIYGKLMLKQKRTVLLSSCVAGLSFYAYSIFGLSQETFLDDFEEPPRVKKDK